MSAVPPGYDFKTADDDYVSPATVAVPASASARVRSEEEGKQTMRNKAWEIGKSPLSNVLYSLVMLYFSGSHLSLMSLMLCFMMLAGPVKAFLGFRSTFAPFDQALKRDAALLRSKAVFLMINSGVFAIAIWKTWQLGILPITEADWMRYASVFTTATEVDFTEFN